MCSNLHIFSPTSFLIKILFQCSIVQYCACVREFFSCFLLFYPCGALITLTPLFVLCGGKCDMSCGASVTTVINGFSSRSGYFTDQNRGQNKKEDNNKSNKRIITIRKWIITKLFSKQMNKTFRLSNLTMFQECCLNPTLIFKGCQFVTSFLEESIYLSNCYATFFLHSIAYKNLTSLFRLFFFICVLLPVCFTLIFAIGLFLSIMCELDLHCNSLSFIIVQ